MKHYLNLVPISAEIHRKQSKMTRICITLAVFLVAVMFGLADMYLQGVIQKQMQESGNWHYQLNTVDTQTAALISVHPEVELSGWHHVISSDTGYSVGGEAVAVSGVIWGSIIGLPTQWSIPFVPLGLIIAIVFLTSLFAVWEPASRLHQMSIVENIRAQ